MASRSIDLGDISENKINATFILISAIVASGEGGDPRQQAWESWFYTYLMWHESAQLTTREQSGGGSGRGLMQFEATTAWDTINIFIVHNAARVARLADAAGVATDTMQTAL